MSCVLIHDRMYALCTWACAPQTTNQSLFFPPTTAVFLLYSLVQHVERRMHRGRRALTNAHGWQPPMRRRNRRVRTSVRRGPMRVSHAASHASRHLLLGTQPACNRPHGGRACILAAIPRHSSLVVRGATSRLLSSRGEHAQIASHGGRAQSIARSRPHMLRSSCEHAPPQARCTRPPTRARTYSPASNASRHLTARRDVCHGQSRSAPHTSNAAPG